MSGITNIELITPNARQREFFEATAPHVCYGGARGGGKSTAARVKAVLLCVKYPMFKALMLRRTYPELEANHIRPLRLLLRDAASYSVTGRRFEFPNGSSIKMGYCDSEDDVLQYQGQEYDAVFMEEATHFTERQWQFIRTCNRTSRTDFSPRMYYTCNPGGVGHNWVKRVFIDKRYNEREQPSDYMFIPATVYDNEALMRSDPEYVRQLEALPDDLRRMHLYGDWDACAGQYFAEFSKEKHVVQPFEIPRWWKRIASIDWGYNDPCCMLLHAVSPDGRLYTYREYYMRQRLASEVAASFNAMTAGESIAYAAASPDMWQKRGAQLISENGVTGESIADVFLSSGVPLIKADNARVLGWNRVREYLAGKPPRWQCFSNCTELIRTLPLLTYDDRQPEDVAGNCEDHAAEALRYAMMSRPPATPIPQAKQLSQPAFDPFSGGRARTYGSLEF